MSGDAPLTKIREAFRGVLSDDSPLTTLLGGDNIFYRPRKANITVPSVTFFDFGTRPDPGCATLMDRTVQFDVWTRTLEAAEDIAHRIRQLLDQRPMELDGGEARPVYLHLQGDRDIPEEEGDIAHKVLEFRLLAYDQVAGA